MSRRAPIGNSYFLRGNSGSKMQNSQFGAMPGLVIAVEPLDIADRSRRHMGGIRRGRRGWERTVAVGGVIDGMPPGPTSARSRHRQLGQYRPALAMTRSRQIKSMGRGIW
jgi:hypothetical protein